MHIVSSLSEYSKKESRDRGGCPSISAADPFQFLESLISRVCFDKFNGCKRIFDQPFEVYK